MLVSTKAQKEALEEGVVGVVEMWSGPMEMRAAMVQILELSFKRLTEKVHEANLKQAQELAEILTRGEPTETKQDDEGTQTQSTTKDSTTVPSERFSVRAMLGRRSKSKKDVREKHAAPVKRRIEKALQEEQATPPSVGNVALGACSVGSPVKVAAKVAYGPLKVHPGVAEEDASTEENSGEAAAADAPVRGEAPAQVSAWQHPDNGNRRCSAPALMDGQKALQQLQAALQLSKRFHSRVSGREEKLLSETVLATIRSAGAEGLLRFNNEILEEGIGGEFRPVEKRRTTVSVQAADSTGSAVTWPEGTVLHVAYVDGGIVYVFPYSKAEKKVKCYYQEAIVPRALFTEMGKCRTIADEGL
jgi:hypothetical protein